MLSKQEQLSLDHDSCFSHHWSSPSHSRHWMVLSTFFNQPSRQLRSIDRCTCRMPSQAYSQARARQRGKPHCDMLDLASFPQCCRRYDLILRRRAIRIPGLVVGGAAPPSTVIADSGLSSVTLCNSPNRDRSPVATKARPQSVTELSQNPLPPGDACSQSHQRLPHLSTTLHSSSHPLNRCVCRHLPS